jgi:hypothetical protein
MSSINLYSQEIVEKDSLWTSRGNIAVLLNQTGFSDWVGGGTNNFSGTIKFDYEWEFKEKGWDWLTNVESAFGLAKYKNAPFARKIDDRILIQSIVGKEFTRNLSFSAFFSSVVSLSHFILIVLVLSTPFSSLYLTDLSNFFL